MGVHVEWDNEEMTAILWSFVGRWTWGEFDDAMRAATAMLETVEHQVDCILDVRQMMILPPDVVSRVKEHYLRRSDNAGRILAVGLDANLQLFWDTFTTLPYAQHLKAHYFDTLEEARHFYRDKSNQA